MTISILSMSPGPVGLPLLNFSKRTISSESQLKPTRPTEQLRMALLKRRSTKDTSYGLFGGRVVVGVFWHCHRAFSGKAVDHCCDKCVGEGGGGHAK